MEVVVVAVLEVVVAVAAVVVTMRTGYIQGAVGNT